jgi:serine/threonine-protein kinase RsbT
VAPLTVPASVRLSITAATDVEQARREARSLARAHGFSGVNIERLALAVSELATNLLRYAHDGQITLTVRADADGTGIDIESLDQGPGIPSIARAMEDGFSTGGGFGDGLPAVRRLLDSFDISSSPNGTRVMARLCQNDR